MKTTDVRNLVGEVLRTLPPPYSEHVIEDVFLAIERSSAWRKEYDGLCEVHGSKVVNSLGGYWIGRALGKRGKKQVTSTKSALVGSYSILDTDAKPPKSKPKEDEATQIMSQYFYANKAMLPPQEQMKKHREQIIELIMDGLDPQAAFELVLQPAP